MLSHIVVDNGYVEFSDRIFMEERSDLDAMLGMFISRKYPMRPIPGIPYTPSIPPVFVSTETMPKIDKPGGCRGLTRYPSVVLSPLRLQSACPVQQMSVMEQSRLIKTTCNMG